MEESRDNIKQGFIPEVPLHIETYVSIEVPTKGGLLPLTLFPLPRDHKDQARVYLLLPRSGYKHCGVAYKLRRLMGDA